MTRSSGTDAIERFVRPPTTAAEARRALDAALEAALELSGAAEGFVAIARPGSPPEFRATSGVDDLVAYLVDSAEPGGSIRLGSSRIGLRTAETGDGGRVLVGLQAPRERLDRAAPTVLLGLARAALVLRDQRRSAEVQRLHATAQRVAAASLDLGSVLTEIVRDAVELLGADSGDMLLADEERRVLRVVAVANFPEDMVGFEMGLGEGVSSQAMAARKTKIVDDYRRYRHRVKVLDRYGFRAVLCAPLIARDDAIGALNVHATEPDRRFTSEDAALLLTFANHAAIAIDNARRYDNEVRLAHDLRRVNEELERSLTLQQRVVQQVAADRGPTAVAAELADLLGRPVVLHDHLFRVLGGADPDGDPEWGNIALPRQAASDPSVAAALAEAVATRSPVTLGGSSPELGRLVVPVTTGADVSGYLVVRSDGELGSLDRALVEIAATGVALELAKVRAQLEADARIQGDLVDDLVSARFTSAEAMAARAAQAGYDLEDPRAVLAFRADTADPMVPGKDVDRRVFDVLRSELATSSPGSIVGAHGDHIAVLSRDLDGADAMAAAEGLRTIVKRDAGISVSVGVGAVCREAESYAAAFASAAGAVDAMVKLGKRGIVVDAARLGIDRLVVEAADRTGLESFALRTVQPLIGGDGHRRELLETLRAYVDSGFNQRETARRCFLHFNTVAYRLRRAEALLGLDLDDAGTRLDVAFALRIGALLDLF